MPEPLQRPDGVSTDARWLLKTRLTDEQLAPPVAGSIALPSREQVIRVLNDPRTRATVVALWHFHFMTSAQLDQLIPGGAQHPLAILRSLGIVHERRQGTVVVHRLCGEARLRKLTALAGSDLKGSLTGSHKPLRLRPGHVRHDLLVVEAVLHLLASYAGLSTLGLGGEVAAFRAVRNDPSGGEHGLRHRVPYADAKIDGDGVVLVEVTATASREQLKEKFMRWIETLDSKVMRRCHAVVFVNACPPEERAEAARLHRDVLRESLDHRPPELRQLGAAPWDRGNLEEMFVFRDAWIDWGVL